MVPYLFFIFVFVLKFIPESPWNTEIFNDNITFCDGLRKFDQVAKTIDFGEGIQIFLSLQRVQIEQRQVPFGSQCCHGIAVGGGPIEKGIVQEVKRSAQDFFINKER